jgi:hypothetical protein
VRAAEVARRDASLLSAVMTERAMNSHQVLYLLIAATLLLLVWKA